MGRFGECIQCTIHRYSYVLAGPWPFSGRAGIGPAAAAETCLLGDVALRRWRQKLGAIANCTNTVLGAGTLGVPAAIGLSGLAGSADRQELRGEVP